MDIQTLNGFSSDFSGCLGISIDLDEMFMEWVHILTTVPKRIINFKNRQSSWALFVDATNKTLQIRLVPIIMVQWKVWVPGRWVDPSAPFPTSSVSDLQFCVELLGFREVLVTRHERSWRWFHFYKDTANFLCLKQMWSTSISMKKQSCDLKMHYQYLFPPKLPRLRLPAFVAVQPTNFCVKLSLGTWGCRHLWRDKGWSPFSHGGLERKPMRK